MYYKEYTVSFYGKQFQHKPDGKETSLITSKLKPTILTYDFLFWLCLWLILVSGWWWLHRMLLGVFPPLQFFGSVWEGSVEVFLCMFSRISQWSHLVLNFCLQVCFFFNYRFYFTSSVSSIQIIYFFLIKF